MNRHALVLVIGLATTHLGSAAIAVTGPGGVAEQGRRTAVAAPAPGSNAAALELVSAVIETVSIERGHIVVSGREVRLHPDVRVYRGGQQAGASALRPGQHVRFALEPRKVKTGETRRIVLVQIEG